MDRLSSQPRVFVSSTIADLRDLRSALRYWLEQAGCTVLMSEYNDFDRRVNQNTFESCFAAIGTCDYYILIIGGRKGSDYADDVSVTQKEFRVALDIARSGEINIIPFIRTEVMQALNELRSEMDPGVDKTEIFNRGSKVVKDLDHLDNFVAEVESAAISSISDNVVSGNLWLYRFATFGDIINALSVNMNLRYHVRKQAMLSNLRRILTQNLIHLIQKDDDVPILPNRWMMRIRREFRLTSTDMGNDIELHHDLLQDLLRFYTAIGRSAWLDLSIIDEAIISGEFLEYDHVDRVLKESVFHSALVELSHRMRQYLQVFKLLQDDNYSLIAPLWSRPRGSKESVWISGHAMTLLFKLDDLIRDIINISSAMIRHIRDSQNTFECPPLSPSSPLEDQVQGLNEETASQDDVLQWVADVDFWNVVTMSDDVSQEKWPELLERHPPLANALIRPLVPYMPEFSNKLQSDGWDAAYAWLLSQI